jgi:hypothetical protein
MIHRQSVGPVRTVPEPEDRAPVWLVTHEDGRSNEIHHLDPLKPDEADSPSWDMPSWVVGGIAVSVGILLIVIVAVLNHY